MMASTISTTIHPNFPVTHPGTSSSYSSRGEIREHAVRIMSGENDPTLPELSRVELSMSPSIKEHVASFSHCIYRVPKALRKNNVDFYTPRVVSIGPYHYGNPNYEHMESIKRKALDYMIIEAGHYYNDHIDMYQRKVGEYEAEVRRCYAEKVVLDSDTFVDMMLKDAAFIIFVFYHSRTLSFLVSQMEVADIKHDLILLENQLPFFLLPCVYKIFKRDQKTGTTGEVFLRNMFGTFNGMIPEITFGFEKTLQKSASDFFDRTPNSDPKFGRNYGKETHIVDMLRSNWLMHEIDSLFPDEPVDGSVQEVIYSANNLQKAGIKIISGKQYTKYYAENGPALKVKCTEINDHSMTIYRNMIALEHCQYENEQYVADHFIFLEMLIRGDTDDLLVKKGIIKNKLSNGDDQSTASVIRMLTRDIAYESHPFTMNDVCASANAYCDRYYSKIKKSIRSITWQVGGLIMILLTLTQTICAIITLTKAK